MAGPNDPVVVIGGGASGIVAAISARRGGVPVVICERLSRIGRKVLASGNGRCNLLNRRLENSSYNPASRHLVDSVYSRFGRDRTEGFFEGLGLKICYEEDRAFPATNQSATVLKVLQMELERLSIPVEYEFKVSNISYAGGVFAVSSHSGKKINAGAVILSCGGKSYPALGADGSGYGLAGRFGHTIVEPVPAAVPLVVRDNLCHALQGQKIAVRVKSHISGKIAGESSGDLLFTKYGLSGTATLDISDEVSIAINRNKARDAVLSVDMVPFIDEAPLKEYLSRRISCGISAEDLTVGILPNKFGPALKDVLKTGDPSLIARGLKDRRFKVLGTRGWNEADFTAGGVDVREVDANSLESLRRKGLFFSGEILDVNGKRGGYNLSWAWASGHVTGEEAAKCAR